MFFCNFVKNLILRLNAKSTKKEKKIALCQANAKSKVRRLLSDLLRVTMALIRLEIALHRIAILWLEIHAKHKRIIKVELYQSINSTQLQ